MPRFDGYDDVADGDLADTDTMLVKSGSSTKEVAMSVLKTYTESNPHIFIQSSDPAGAAADGDLWIQIP